MGADARLLALLVRAERRTRRQVRRAIASGQIGTASYRVRQHRAIVAELARAGRAVRALSGVAAAEAYEAGMVRAGAGAARGVTARFAGVHTAAAQEASLRLAGNLERAVAQMGQSSEQAMSRAAGILEETALRAIEGSTRAEASAALVNRLASEGTTALVDAAGRSWSLERYARMAIRTENANVATAGTANRLREGGLPLIEVSDHGTETEICQEFEGGTYSLPGEQVEGYEEIEDLPPFHIACKHVITAAPEGLAALERELGL
jgi:hypothetical protein